MAFPERLQIAPMIRLEGNIFGGVFVVGKNGLGLELKRL